MDARQHNLKIKSKEGTMGKHHLLENFNEKEMRKTVQCVDENVSAVREFFLEWEKLEPFESTKKSAIKVRTG